MQLNTNTVCCIFKITHFRLDKVKKPERVMHWTLAKTNVASFGFKPAK